MILEFNAFLKDVILFLSERFRAKCARLKGISVYAHFRQIQSWLPEKKIAIWLLQLATELFILINKKLYV